MEREDRLPVRRLGQPLSGRMCFLTVASVLLGPFIFHKSQELYGSSKVWKEIMLKQLAVLNTENLKGCLVLSVGGSPVYSAFLAALPPSRPLQCRPLAPLSWAKAKGRWTHRLVGGLLLPASLPHGQVEGILHAGLQTLPRDGDYAVSAGPEVQHTPTGLALWPRTGGETVDPPPPQSRA